jgi:transcriptional regulator with XRE-family HTH domain
MWGEPYSQRSVATAVGRSQTWLSNIENAHRRLDMNELRTLAALYSFEPAVIVGEPNSDIEHELYNEFVHDWWASHSDQPNPPPLSPAYRLSDPPLDESV